MPAITGVGAISSLASTMEQHWTRILRKETGIRALSGEDLPRGLRYAGRVDDDALPADTPSDVLKQGRLISPSSRLGLRAVDEAVRDSGLDLLAISPTRKALYIGSADYSKSGYGDFYPSLREAGADRVIDPERVNRGSLHSVDPFFLLQALTNNLVAFVSRRYQLQGPNTTLASHSPCGLQALDLAVRSLLQDQADVAIVVGTCVWSRFISLFDLDALGLLSPCRAGWSSFRPFDGRRDGFIAGDGAAALVLERPEQARARGARVLGHVRSVASFTDVSETGGLGVSIETVRRTVTTALDDAGLRPKDLAFISPHGNGTRKGDRIELSALTKILDADRAATPISGMKPYTGHLGAASDLAEIAIAITALTNGLAPATLNFRTPDAGFEQLDITTEHRPIRARHAVSMSQGFGGQSLAVALSVPPDQLAALEPDGSPHLPPGVAASWG
jgi:3-oxoacyl-[acyl-carrier-protein] synthase II